MAVNEINNNIELKRSDDIVRSQYDYMKKIREINDEKTRKTGKRPIVAIVTYGCQMNAHDSEKIIGMILTMGYELTEDETIADVVIYNTCCIRENAENKLYGNLGHMKRIKKERKDLKVFLCGCMMQQETVITKLQKSYNFVDIIFGTYNLYKLPELMVSNIQSKAQIIDIWQEQKEIVEDLPSERKLKFKASVNIMYGCNNFCSYCIVPYVRGRERSRESQDILKEVENLVADGVVEITLLGQNVNSYGKNLDEDITFAKLLKMVSEIKGLQRIRFMTSHPKDFSHELIDVIKTCDNVCKHIHLPVQSGSSAILKKMNRHYDRDQYLKLVRKIKSEIPDISLSTDIIVGFPGETDQDNEDTISLIEEVGYASAFTFIYSKRESTPAAAMIDQIKADQAKERFNQVLAHLNPVIQRRNENQIGKKAKVLVESISNQSEGILSGRLDNFSLVHLKGSPDDIGTMVDVVITGCKTFYLIGEKI